MIYMITYDLNFTGQNYEDVIKAIKDCSTGKWCSYWKSSYLIQSLKTADQIQNAIKPYLDTNDRVLVIKVVNNYQGWLSQDQWDYIADMFATDSSF